MSEVDGAVPAAAEPTPVPVPETNEPPVQPPKPVESEIPKAEPKPDEPKKRGLMGWLAEQQAKIEQMREQKGK